MSVRDDDTMRFYKQQVDTAGIAHDDFFQSFEKQLAADRDAQTILREAFCRKVTGVNIPSTMVVAYGTGPIKTFDRETPPGTKPE